MRKTISFLVVLIILSLSVQAIGIRSNYLRVDIDFKPGFEQTYYYSVVPYSSRTMDVILYTADDSKDGTTSNLSQYFTLSDHVLKDVAPGEEPYFSVHVKLPNQIYEPGLHTVHVGAMETIPAGSGMFPVRTAIEALFFIHVPYQGKYLKYSMNAESVNEESPIPVHISYSNLGNQPINSIFTSVDILDSNNIVVGRAATPTISIGPQQSTSANLSISSIGLPSGDYWANATVNYDGMTNSTNDSFKIGSMSIIITNNTEEIFSGKINPVEVEVESHWADTIKGIFAAIKIGNSEEIKTISTDINGFETKKLSGFFDSTNIPPGIYNMTITLHFSDKTVSKITQIRISKQAVTNSPKFELSLTNVLFLIIILVILVINMTLFLLLIKKKDEHDEEKIS